MKNSINHLPSNKQSELKQITDTILQNCDEVEKIILFGSYARGNYKEEKDLEPNRKSGHVSDYDILVVTKTKEVALDIMLWGKISDRCRKLNLSADPRIITYDIQALNIKLAEGQYFYKDIKKEGVIIYNKGNFALADKRELTSKEQKRIAQDEFNSEFGISKEFFINYHNCFKRRSYKIAAFELHQAAEHAYKAIHLVFTNYCPHEHFLKMLSYEIEEYHQDLPKLFPEETKEQKDRFRLLECAYVAARYNSEYYISKEDLEILEKDVERLLEITEEICKKKIASFE